MVNIPITLDLTLEAMKRATEKVEEVRPKRDYLGASLIGKPCVRSIYFKLHGYSEQREYIAFSKAELTWAAESGHLAEDITARRLRMVEGIQLWTHKEDGNQYGWTAMDNKFKGHIDGVILGLLQAPKTTHIWEHKDKNDKYFRDFQNKKNQYGEKNVLKFWNEIYFAQAQVNMHFLQIDRHYTTVSYAGARKYDSCRTEYQLEIAEMYIDRADKILQAKTPPPKISEKPDFFICKMCEFKEHCFGKGL